MQSAAPPAGTATREMSNTESEGHCLSAASFVALKPCTCATKATEFTYWLADKLQIIETYTLTAKRTGGSKKKRRDASAVGMQNPAHSLHCRRTSGVRRQTSGVGPRVLDIRSSESSSLYGLSSRAVLVRASCGPRLSRNLGLCRHDCYFPAPARTQIPPLALTAQARLGTALGMTVHLGVSVFDDPLLRNPNQ
jgi:hypothetical protein